jgi:hypothetical protein
VTSSVNRPTVPTPRVTGLKLRTVTSRRVSGTPEKWLHTFEWGRRTTQEDVEMPATVTLADGSNLKDNATVCKVTSNATPPTPPTAPVGQLVDRDRAASRQRHDEVEAHLPLRQQHEPAGR